VQFDQFLENSERRAYQMALYATRNSEEALDIVQDAMLKLADKYADRPSNEWGPLFHRILQSKINDWHRRQTVRRKWLQLLPFSTGEENDDLIEQAPELKSCKPDDKLEQNRAMEILDNAIKNLPQRQQQAFLLRSWEGLNVAETAAAMNCSQGSVKTHYSRAIHSLRESLEEHI